MVTDLEEVMYEGFGGVQTGDGGLCIVGLEIVKANLDQTKLKITSLLRTLHLLILSLR